MNIRPYLIFCLLTVLLWGCNKSIPQYDPGKFDYKLTTYKVHMATNDSALLYLHFTLTGGYAEKENVTVQLHSIPPNVVFDNTQYSFRLNYDIIVHAKAYNATKGIYPILIDVTSATTGTRQYIDTLIIDTTYHRVNILSGTFTNYNSCSAEPIKKCMIVPIADTSLRFMMIDQLDTATYDTTYAIADNYSPSFTIPAQLINGVTVTGKGSIAPFGHYITMTKYYKVGVATDSCQFVLNRDL